VYLDASALVKLFVPEPESDALNRALVGATNVNLSDLALTEMASAIGRRLREGVLTPAASRELYCDAETLAAACERAELTPPVHRRAERLLLTSTNVPLRTLDALHIALAVHAEAATFVTYDSRLRDGAAIHGLLVVPEGD
jgi:predicted nucleic acid-binding protein